MKTGSPIFEPATRSTVENDRSKLLLPLLTAQTPVSTGNDSRPATRPRRPVVQFDAAVGEVPSPTGPLTPGEPVRGGGPAAQTHLTRDVRWYASGLV